MCAGGVCLTFAALSFISIIKEESGLSSMDFVFLLDKINGSNLIAKVPFIFLRFMNSKIAEYFL